MQINDEGIIIKKKGIMIKIEDRSKYNYYDYGFSKNHGEILNYINSVDNDCWDCLLLTQVLTL